MSLFLLVEVASEEARNEVFALPQSQEMAGVVLHVTDVDAISLTTLQQWLLPVEETWEYQQKQRPKKVSTYDAIRRYHRERRQPPLFNE